MKRILTAAILMALLLPSVAFAVTGTIQARANVLTPLTVTNNLRDLDFGDVFPGLNKSIAFTDATSGKWRIAGEAGREVQLSFTLPPTLDFGANTIPISFANGDAGWNPVDNSGTAVGFDPGGATLENLSAVGEGYVWLGGTVAPAANQPAGVYTGTVSLDVVYTGN